jgi:putative tryptophan/tyrosine transport system substrate-binding protein
MAAEHHGQPISRRRFVQGSAAVGLGLLAGCERWRGQAEAPAPVLRIAFLSNSPLSSLPVEVLREGLRDHGYVDGQTIYVDYRSADGQGEPRLAELAADLLRLNPALVITVGNLTPSVLKRATSKTPIVMVASENPVGTGLVASVARPGGNVTGLGSHDPLDMKQLELLKDAVPSVARVAVLLSGTLRPNAPTRLQPAAEALGITLVPLDVDSADELNGAFEYASRNGATGLVGLRTNLTLAHPVRIAELATRYGMASVFPHRLWVEAGALLAYGDNLAAQFRRAAYYVDRIHKGTKPADLPVEQPREFEMVINLRTAQALGLTIPPHVLLQATEVLQ